MENQNTEYEKLAQEIYQTLHRAEGIQTIDVQHNVKVKGKSGCEHQIDVYWEFKIADVAHRVAIEAKNYGSEVPIGRVRDFFGALHDIGDIKGIMVTKVGYQRGAKAFADFYKIDLKELRYPEEQDWNGRVKTLVIEMVAFMPSIVKREPLIDLQWLRDNNKIKEGEPVQITFSGMSNEILITKISGERITDFHEMESNLPNHWKEEKNLEHTYQFADGFILTKNLGMIKINGVKFTYDMVSSTTVTKSDGEKIAHAILKDVRTGQIKFFDKDGNVK